MHKMRLGRGHVHQERTAEYGVRLFESKRRRTFSLGGRSKAESAGILLADGVGMGKTYEALATVSSWLIKRQWGRLRRRRPRVLVIVPPSLVSKWRDELYLEDKWPRYMKKAGLDKRHRAVYDTFLFPIVIRHGYQLDQLREKQHRRGVRGNCLAPGLYIVNNRQINLTGDGRESLNRLRDLISRTPWDAVIVDEAHDIRIERLERVLCWPRSRVLLLTATPFQLKPDEIRGVLSGLFFPNNDAAKSWSAAEEAFGRAKDHPFVQYRKGIKDAFEAATDEEKCSALARARKPKQETQAHLGRLMVRNISSHRRDYFLVDSNGHEHALTNNPAWLSESELDLLLKQRRDQLIRLTPAQEYYYLTALSAVTPIERSALKSSAGFGGYRQILSSYSQFKRSPAGRRAEGPLARLLSASQDGEHPRFSACLKLVERLVRDELKQLPKKGYFGKIVIFLSFVGTGSQEGEALQLDSGTLPKLKVALENRLQRILEEHRSKGPHPYLQLAETLRRAVQREERRLLKKVSAEAGENWLAEWRSVERVLSVSQKGRSRREGWSRLVARLMLGRPRLLDREKSLIDRRVAEASQAFESWTDAESSQAPRIARERFNHIRESLLDRYKTKKLVAAIHGGMDRADAETYRAAFNASGAPLVLLASPVSQVGIDLQTFSEHVIHYDLEWNAAKMEQREGRVDRLERFSDENRVKVYYLLCDGTYDERMFRQISRRQLWRQLLVGKNHELDSDGGDDSRDLTGLTERQFKAVALDLSPGRI